MRCVLEKRMRWRLSGGGGSGALRCLAFVAQECEGGDFSFQAVAQKSLVGRLFL